MSDFRFFDLSDYNTKEELDELLDELELELSTLRGYQRGAQEKLQLIENDDESED